MLVVPPGLEPGTPRSSVGRSTLELRYHVAGGEGFEPPDPFRGLQFSRLTPSTARPSTRELDLELPRLNTSRGLSSWSRDRASRDRGLEPL